MENKEIAQKLCACFDGVNLSLHTFNVNGMKIEAEGDTKFLPESQVRKLINNIDALYLELKTQ